ncbi:MAG TPA: hypothetical protein VF241_15875 [Propionibacteriaceae bacterium]
MTSMVLASAYFGGAYFFVRVLFDRRWNVIKIGFVSVTLFASLLGVATVMHWRVFNHRHVTFWLWAALYFTTPFLVFGAWLATSAPQALLPQMSFASARTARWVIGLIGLLALIQGLIMFVAPQLMMPFWPWSLTPLTCRVIGAIFCLGIAGLGVFADPQWSSITILLEVEMIMIPLMLVAALRALRELHPHRVLTWLLGGGFVAVLVGSVYLWVAMTAGRRIRSGPDEPAQAENAGLLEDRE